MTRWIVLAVLAAACGPAPPARLPPEAQRETAAQRAELPDDGDRIDAADDRCPLEPETYNGVDDEDGCPDEAPAGLVIECGVPTTERVYYQEGSAALREPSMALLRALADTIEANPSLGVVELLGHADPSEGDGARLARARAEGVRDALVSFGVDPARLAARSLGADDPMTAGRTEEERAHNRRVELRLAEASE